jgi:predicted glycogen debranching enzyme
LDWGRDTFIFLRGAIADGRLDDAEKILAAFAAFEENGTLPNLIYGETAGNRDTVDAQLWFVLCVKEWTAKVGGKRRAAQRLFRSTVESIVENYVKGTPNGIHVDMDSGLVWTPSHFTWMDTNYPACTPRCGYPVDIQAMWIAALRFVGGEWNALADKAAESVMRYFAGKEGFADCLDAWNGESAAQAAADFSVRPNQLHLVTLDAVTDLEMARRIVDSCERLLVPGGIRSLAAGDSKYRGCYSGDEDSSRKPAYHNGTVWAWPMPLYAEAAVKCGRLTPSQAGSLLASVLENINTECLCHVSEIADGDAPHAQKGCRAQAWSVSEFLRVLLLIEVRTDLLKS